MELPPTTTFLRGLLAHKGESHTIIIPLMYFCNNNALYRWNPTLADQPPHLQEMHIKAALAVLSSEKSQTKSRIRKKKLSTGTRNYRNYCLLPREEAYRKGDIVDFVNEKADYYSPFARIPVEEAQQFGVLKKPRQKYLKQLWAANEIHIQAAQGSRKAPIDQTTGFQPTTDTRK